MNTHTREHDFNMIVNLIFILLENNLSSIFTYTLLLVGHGFHHCDKVKQPTPCADEDCLIWSTAPE